MGRLSTTWTVNGRAKVISLGANGKGAGHGRIGDPLMASPQPARAAIQKAVGTGELNKVESVTQRGTTIYEAASTKGSKNSEVKVAANGKAVTYAGA